MDCYVSISLTAKIFFWSIVTLASRALLQFLLIDCYVGISSTVGFSLDVCYVGISRTPKILFWLIITLASCVLLRFSLDGSLC